MNTYLKFPIVETTAHLPDSYYVPKMKYFDENSNTVSKSTSIIIFDASLLLKSGQPLI